MAAHAKLAPSAAERWGNCPGSIAATAEYENTSSPYAVEGSRAHEVGDRCLTKGWDADKMIGKKILGEKVPADMAPFVQEYLDYVRAHETKSTEMRAEVRVDISHIVPECFGTLDATVIDFDLRICHIFDLKYGKGIQVYAFENWQMMLYALGLLKELEDLDEVDTFRLHIVQPRKVTPEPWDISVVDLRKFGELMTERAELALTKSAPRVPGEKQCQWCDAKANCPALANFVEETIMGDFDDLDDIKVERLSDDDKKKILDNKSLIQDFLGAVESSVYKVIDDGGKFPGYKIVLGKSNRAWNDLAEKWLKRKLKDKAYSPAKLIGIGAAEKLLGKGNLFYKSKGEEVQVTHKPEGKPALVLESDPRPAVGDVDVADDFEEL